jgi:hypothetical protein
MEALTTPPKATRTRKMSPRRIRVLEALLARQGCWIFREEIDRIAGSSNGPDVVAQLRHRHDVEIDMRMVPRIDRDGRACEVGQYKLTEHGIEAATALLHIGGADV